MIWGDLLEHFGPLKSFYSPSDPNLLLIGEGQHNVIRRICLILGITDVELAQQAMDERRERLDRDTYGD